MLFRSLSALALVAVSSAAFGQIFNESTDVGNLPGSAQTVTTTGSTLTINGSISVPLDQDMYRITIGNAGAFSATVTSSGAGIEDDTQIFLFRLNGQGIAFNDDITADNFLSHLPVGNALYNTLAPGDYLLAISPFDIDPRVNSGTGTDISDYVFPFNAPPDNTLITGPRTSSPIVAWDTDPNFQGGAVGTYQIQITGLQAVPEPTTMAAMGLGLLALVRRRKR